MLFFCFSQIIYGSIHTVIGSLVALTFLTHYGVLRAAEWLKPVESQRLIILIELYVLWWFFLLFDTILLYGYNIGALYPIIFFHAGALLGLLIGFLEVLLLPGKTASGELPRDPDDPDTITEYVVERQENSVDHERGGSSENTPLLRRKVVGLKSEQNEKGVGSLWIFQYVLSVPFPVLFAAQTVLFAMHSLHQTLADGASPTNGMTCKIFAASINSLHDSLRNCSFLQRPDGSTARTVRAPNPLWIDNHPRSPLRYCCPIQSFRLTVQPFRALQGVF